MAPVCDVQYWDWIKWYQDVMCSTEPGYYGTRLRARVPATEHHLLDQQVLPPFLPVSYTHLTLPTICSV
eukprot:1607662-Rhodomonas_salina.1